MAYFATYSLRVVVDHLDSKEMKYKFASGGGGAAMCLYDHGCKVLLSNGFELSVQTHPMLVGPAFAETALIKDGKLVWFMSNDGDEVIRHDTPEALFEHIELALTHSKQLL
jgi:hypothetical protein